MEVTEFQKRLEDICETAKSGGNRLSQEQIRLAFEGMSLEPAQLRKILTYLKIQGIEIEGAAEAADGTAKTSGDKKSSAGMSNAGSNQKPSAGQPDTDDTTGSSAAEMNKENAALPGTPVPLTPEEKAWLTDYLAELSEQAAQANAGNTDAQQQTNNEAGNLFKKLAQGDTLAMAALSQKYLPVAAQMAAEMNCAEIALPDLIQEADVALLTALSEPEPAQKNDLWLRSEIRKGIIEAIEEQTQQKFQDDCLVSKVEKLEAAVRDLTDDDGENRFSVDELAVILDMKVDEIQDILKLTGDDK